MLLSILWAREKRLTADENFCAVYPSKLDVRGVSLVGICGILIGHKLHPREGLPVSQGHGPPLAFGSRLGPLEGHGTE